MTRWHDRLVGVWFGMLVAAVVFVAFQVLTSPGIQHVLTLRELFATATLWIIAGGVVGLPFLVVAVILDRAAKAKRVLPNP